MGFIAKNIGHKRILKPLNTKSKKRDVLLDLLFYANQNVPFYKGRYSEFLKQQGEWDDQTFWEEFAKTPVTTKQDLKDHNDDFCSNTYAAKKMIVEDGQTPKALDILKSVFIKKDFKISISTGGTSGIPTYRWLDEHDCNVMAQSFFESFHDNGWRRGENFVLYYPLRSYFTGTYAAFNNWLSRLFGFSVVPFENVTAQSVRALLKELEDRKATLLVIFPCVMQRVAEIMHEEGIPPFAALKNINVSGEFFFDCSKDFIQEMFPNSKIEITYGAVELGEVAHQYGPSSQDYLVFDDFAHVEETEDDSLLITSLRQKTFPMIRYKMEDKASVITTSNSRQLLVNLEGKNTDYLIGADGEKYYASFFNRMVNAINSEIDKNIIHFMMRHEGGTAQLNFVLKSDDAAHKAKIESEAISIVGKTFPQFKNITVTFPAHFDHDYTRKFKIIGEGDGLAEVVGGFYKKKAG